MGPLQTARQGFGSEYWLLSRPDLGARSSWMIFSAQRTWGRRTNSHALRNFAPSGNPAAMSCRGRRQPHRGALARFPGEPSSNPASASRAGLRKNRCVSWVWTFHFLFKGTCVGAPGEPKMAPSPRRSREQAQLAGIAARVSTINGLEVSPRHAGRHPDEWLFDTGRQIIPPPAVSGRRFAGAGPRSTVRPARQACRSVDEKFRPAEPEQSSRSWRRWLRRSHGPSFATRP